MDFGTRQAWCDRSMTTAPSGQRPIALPGDDILIRETEALTLRILTRADEVTTRAERARAHRLNALLSDEAGRDLLLDLTDQVLRIRDPHRSARRLHDLTTGTVPTSLGFTDRLGLRALGLIAPAVPVLAERAVDWRIDRDTAGVILPADDPAFAQYVQGRRAEGFRLNVNVLGESILGDEEAAERCRKVVARIRRPDVDYVSVKISALCANLDVLAEADSLDSDRGPAARGVPGCHEHEPTHVRQPRHGGVPRSRALAACLHGGARRARVRGPPGRHRAAGVPPRLACRARAALHLGERPASPERARASRSGSSRARTSRWSRSRPRCTTGRRRPTDEARLRRARTSACSSARWSAGDPGAVRIGVASHNLFEIAWAITVCAHLGAAERLDIEMLEGMAPPQSRAVREVLGELLLYAPVVEKQDREASIAYLSRRLDENSSPRTS